MAQSVRITRIIALTDHVATELRGLQFAGFRTPASSWQPAVNVYAHPDGLEVCVDLAGVRPEDVAVQAEPRRLRIQGHREPPDCGKPVAGCGRILIMEIPDGSFERIIEFSVEIDPHQVKARQSHGWLWISLPRPTQEAAP
jgi:HSP20 family molecular chaperone IbpA